MTTLVDYTVEQPIHEKRSSVYLPIILSAISLLSWVIAALTNPPTNSAVIVLATIILSFLPLASLIAAIMVRAKLKRQGLPRPIHVTLALVLSSIVVIFNIFGFILGLANIF